MKFEAVLHIIDSAYAYAYEEDKVVFRIRTAKNDIERCSLFFGDRVCEERIVTMQKIEMTLVARDALFDYFEIHIHTPYTRVCYYFLLEDGRTSYYYYGGEFKSEVDEDRTLYYQFPYVRREEVVRVPDWANEAVMYQIFPDSFASDTRFIEGQPKEINIKPGQVSKSYFGGRLKGIEKNIDYLTELGVNCLYLNPIFEATEWHKYDIRDYKKVDPCFGTMEDFKSLVVKCHQNGIRVLLDGVFNHSGWQFFAFQDVLQKGELSRYKDWFYNIHFPVNYDPVPSYECFAYVKEMPKLNTSNPEVVAYFCEVAKYWIEEADIDGWRLDVANEIDHEFWRKLRAAVKSVKEEAFLVAEIWEDAENWLGGDQFDSAMNYKFSYLCTRFFAEQSMGASEFDQCIHRMLMRYKHPVTYVQMNLLDSHDVIRFLSRANGNVDSYKLAVLYQMMFVGIPSVFYGDEKGIMGITEREYRRPMVWQDDEGSQELTIYFKKLIAIRKQYMKQMTGAYTTIEANDNYQLYIYRRGEETDGLLIVINRSSEPRETEINTHKTSLCNLLGEAVYQTEHGKCRILLHPMEGKILV